MATAFDLTKLPRARLLAEAFGDQNLPETGWGKVRCTLPGCEHTNGDRSPSLRVNVESGGFECLKSGRKGTGWKALVIEWWGEERWAEVVREAFGAQSTGRGRAPTLLERWEALSPEVAWTTSLGIAHELSRAYLRAGHRYPGDPRSESVVALRGITGELVGLKWRLPSGEAWRVGAVGKRDPRAKYALTKGSDPAQVFLADRAQASATLLVCAGEKDALVAASHLPAEAWAPLSGSFGEGKVPPGLRELAKDRDVVVAYDGDEAGHWGAWRVCEALGRIAKSLRVAFLPEGVPPGKDRPGWDLSELVQVHGPAALLELLSRVGPIPDEWRAPLPKTPPGGSPPKAPRDESPADGDGDGDEEVVYALEDWDEVDGQVVVWTDRGRGKHKRRVPVCQFRGRPRVKEVRSVLSEDPSLPNGWAETEEVVYELELKGAGKLEKVAAAGREEFAALLDHTRLAGATELSRRDLWRLHLWTVQRSKWRELREVRAVGPHQGHGWIAPGNVSVRDGEVRPTPYMVGPPTEAEEFRRYRLEIIGERALADAARWIVEELLCCDHAGQAYTLPLLGFVIAAPLWEYVTPLQSWQRAAAFVQGPSGTGKSQLIRYFLGFWGNFTSGQGLTTWKSSATYAEELMHHAVGVPLALGDFKLGNLRGEKMAEATGLIQAYADRTARGRAGRGGSKAERKRPPRCSLILDGEDLPEGEQSILGRLLVLHVQGIGPTGRCATAQEDVLPPTMMALLPGVTSRWIAWVQRNSLGLEQRLDVILGEMERQIRGSSTNRSRLVRSYAVQDLAVDAFLSFLEETGTVGSLADLKRKARAIHVGMATTQLSLVASESAGELFLQTLSVLLASGQVFLAPQDPAGSSGAEPWVRERARGSVCVGTYHKGAGYVWPGVAYPSVQAHLTKGGGNKIAFSVAAIRQQLQSGGLLLGTPRQRVADLHPSKDRIYTWEMDLRELGGYVRVADELSPSGDPS